MCDYSLHAQKTRKAEVGDKLIVDGFTNTATRGMRRPGIEDMDTATCMLPGTEVAFDKPPTTDRTGSLINRIIGRVQALPLVASFCQIDRGRLLQHHDALKFVNGEIVLINELTPGQQMTVLQLGVEEPAAEPKMTGESAPISGMREHWTTTVERHFGPQAADSLTGRSVWAHDRLTSGDDERTKDVTTDPVSDTVA